MQIVGNYSFKKNNLFYKFKKKFSFMETKPINGYIMARLYNESFKQQIASICDAALTKS